MKQIVIHGGCRLEGILPVQGAKNSVLPVLAATILHPGITVLRGCPRLSDVEASVRILRHLGCRADWQGEELVVDTSSMNRWDIPDHLMREMRSSVIFLGAILARLGRAEMSYPGGCELGPRPIDLHLGALRRLGAAVEEGVCVLDLSAPFLEGEPEDPELARRMVYGLVNTLCSLNSAAVELVRIRVEGEPVESYGGMALTSPLSPDFSLEH